jgi:hypothetical protein
LRNRRVERRDERQDDVLILAVAVCIDEMAHEGR